MRNRNEINHVLKFQQLYLTILGILILGITQLINFLSNKPPLLGEETFYYLSKLNIPIPELWPYIIFTLTITLFYIFAKQTKLSKRFTFFYSLLFFIAASY